MARARVSFLCGSCGAVQPKWVGRCPECGGWDTLERFVEPAVNEIDDAARAGAPGARSPAGPQPLASISTDAAPRLETGVAELDRVLGGGFVPGSTILLGGEPGIGKSTLLLQALLSVARRGHLAHYATSEESAHQVKLRADRLRTDASEEPSENLLLHAESLLDRVLEHARRRPPAVLAIDSIQLVARSGLDAAPGSIVQLRRCCMDLVHFAKQQGCTVIIVGHVTKEGLLSGPKTLEHMVDAVLSFEGDRHHLHRAVRATKNRFGSTQEVGLFEMSGNGLMPVDDSALTAEAALEPRPGAALVVPLAGSRAILAEVQALTATGFLGSAKRKTSGVDAARTSMLIAVLEKHGGLRLADQDVYVACAGGLRVTEPAVDLGIALAIAGSHLRRTLPPRTAVIGEVSLAGEVRPVRQIEARLAAARRRGIDTILVPAANAMSAEGLTLRPIRRISDAIDCLAPASRGAPGTTGRSGRSTSAPLPKI
ncbi:MAG: DNA repair protein RadA [Phycisphaeraceae bacterium]|nr:DNA repair protein RadA [Phycisphaeraceae bacterium]